MLELLAFRDPTFQVAECLARNVMARPGRHHGWSAPRNCSCHFEQLVDHSSETVDPSMASSNRMRPLLRVRSYRSHHHDGALAPMTSLHLAGIGTTVARTPP